jgi:hypothetical protein
MILSPPLPRATTAPLPRIITPHHLSVAVPLTFLTPRLLLIASHSNVDIGYVGCIVQLRSNLDSFDSATPAAIPRPGI